MGGGWWRRPRATYGQGGGGWGRLVVAGEGGRQRQSAGVGLWCVIIMDVVLWKVRCNVDT